MKPLTPQQIAAATAKRQAAIAARKANGGLTVRQQRAAAKAAKAGQPAPPPPAPKPSTPPGPRPSFRGRRRRTFHHVPPPRPAAPVTPPAAPVFATPAPTARALKLTALAAVEALFKQRLMELGAANVTDEHRADFAKYKKLMGTALAPVATVAMQNEADVALRLAVQKLVKHAF